MLLTPTRSADFDLARRALRHGPTVATIVVVETSLVLSYGIGQVLPALLLVAAVGPLLARIDVVERRLPFTISAPLFAATALLLAGTEVLTGQAPVGRATTCAFGWAAFYGALHAGTRGRGMGLGDVVIAPTLGLVLGWIGWGTSVVGLVAGFAVGALASVLLVATRRNERASLPFGPFMLAGAWLGVMFGPAIWAGYLAGTR